MTVRPYVFIMHHDGWKQRRERLTYTSDLAARKFADTLNGCIRVETDAGRVVWRKTTGDEFSLARVPR